MATAFHVSLVTPERILFSGPAEEVSLRTDGGEIAFLARHEDYVGVLDITVVRIATTGAANELGESVPSGELLAAVHGGFVHVDASGVTILAGVAELASEIDIERAKRALDAAEAAGATGEPTSGTAEREDGASAIDSTGRSAAMLAILAPELAEVAARRARVRLEAAGVPTSH
jgi:F-type H+-transporting ATPase subunit epsilon